MKPEQLERSLHRAARRIEGSVDLMREVARIAQEEAHREIRGGRNRAYKSGNLDRSIYAQVKSPHEAVVGAGATYANFVHDGTRYMRARPFIEDGIAAGSERIKRAAEAFGERALGEVSG